jgi:chromosome segregation ATPase
MTQNIAEMKKFHQEQLAKAEAEKRAMKEEYDDMLQESESLFKDEYAKYESEHMQVQKLRLKLEKVTAQAASQEKLRIMETQLLEESIKTAKMQLEAKEREIAIKNENLREERSKVTDLEATVKVLERSLRKNEIDAAARIEELSLKVNEGNARYAKLEEEKDNIITESKKARAKLQDKIMLLETEFTNLKGEIVSKDSQLEQRQSTIKSLLTVKEELEQKIRSYNDDVQTLMAAYEETKDEYSNSLRKLKAEREKDNFSLKAEYNQMKASAIQTESELDSALKANQRLKDLISEKTRVIGDLEARIEELERGNDDKETIISDLQNKYHAEQDMVDELKRRISSLNFEKKKEIKIHLDKLEEERSLCLDLQKRLEETQMKLDEWKDNAKENKELKAENFLLKDKIDRQQAFIERKLENEKKKRGQVICNPNPNLKSPPRRSSARSRSLTRKSIDAPRLGLGAPRNRSRSTSVGPTDSPELQQKSASDELDELLGTFNEI